MTNNAMTATAAISARLRNLDHMSYVESGFLTTVALA
jgi:hypothetical protein